MLKRKNRNYKIYTFVKIFLMKKNLHSITAALLLFCSIASLAQTSGNLTFTLTTPMHASGNYVTDGRYALAIWIESSTGTFIKTKRINWGGAQSNTGDHLPNWVSKSGSNTTDATSGATLNTFTAKTITWNGTNVSNTVVADGAYRVAVQETWGHGTATAIRYFNFTKGTAVDAQTPAADTNFTNISLNWSPLLATETFLSNPAATLYPNPTKGIFTIDYKNNVNNIKVINILGEVVMNINISEAQAESSRNIDLTRFSNGMYIIKVTNEKTASNYKLILNK